jgi:glucosamine-6-phosphate deaminase
MAATFYKKFEGHVNALPCRQTILVVSPHPDDDVISMGATLQKLVKQDNDVHVVYVVTGHNAVRDGQTQQDKTIIREKEATDAATYLSIKPENLHFFRADYYMRRGMPGVDPLSSQDLTRMISLITDVTPEVIYFAAEEDPNGAHGLSSTLVARALAKLNYDRVQILGYRGAWSEWDLTDLHDLEVVTFTLQEMNRKIESIKKHVSQLNPVYPGVDPREFYERAADRNKSAGEQFSQIMGFGASTEVYVEAFKHFSYSDFIERYC